MSRSPSMIWPEVGVSSPATMRRVVVLPHPEGPSSAKNDPAGTSRSSDLTAANSLVRLRSRRPSNVWSDGTRPSVSCADSATCDIRPVSFVLLVLRLGECHEVERALQVGLVGED